MIAVSWLLALTLLACGPGTAADERAQLPEAIRVQITYERLDLRNATVTVTYEGDQASAIRAMLDLDADGVLSPTEVDAHARGVRGRISRESALPNTTLDGMRATRVSYTFDTWGAEGNAEDTAPLRFTMTQTLEFPSPRTAPSHTYCFETAIGGDEPWENKLVGDDPWGDEAIGGDEPWENVFYGGIVPWGDEAIGGDEPWENKVKVDFRMEAPQGWRFMTGNWPPALFDYLNSGKDAIEMDSAAAATYYASTIGRMNILAFEDLGREVGEASIPACLAILALAAGGRVGTLVSRR